MIEENTSDKYKEKDKKHGGETVAQTPSVSTVVAPTQLVASPQEIGGKPTTQNTATNPEQPIQKIEKEMSVFEKRMLIATWLGICIGVITGLVFIGQFRQMKNQTGILSEQAATSVRNMKIDQRPWVKIGTVGDVHLTDGVPFAVPLRIVNVGKTAATNLAVVIVVETIKKGKEPAFIYETGHPRSIIPGSGVLFPTDQFDFEAYMLRGNAPSAPERVITTPSIRQEMAAGESHLLIHGIVTYDDIFSTHHWLKFCMANVILPIKAGTDPGLTKCVERNSTDNN